MAFLKCGTKGDLQDFWPWLVRLAKKINWVHNIHWFSNSLWVRDILSSNHWWYNCGHLIWLHEYSLIKKYIFLAPRLYPLHAQRRIQHFWEKRNSTKGKQPLLSKTIFKTACLPIVRWLYAQRRNGLTLWILNVRQIIPFFTV